LTKEPQLRPPIPPRRRVVRHLRALPPRRPSQRAGRQGPAAAYGPLLIASGVPAARAWVVNVVKNPVDANHQSDNGSSPTGRTDRLAAKILGETADVNRFGSEDAFARYAGVGPVPRWSGRSEGRMRYMRTGNRQLNMALDRIAMIQIRAGGLGATYYRHRISMGTVPPWRGAASSVTSLERSAADWSRTAATARPPTDFDASPASFRSVTVIVILPPCLQLILVDDDGAVSIRDPKVVSGRWFHRLAACSEGISGLVRCRKTAFGLDWALHGCEY
jgi:hypothetical protein